MARVSCLWLIGCLLGACEPASITEARNQLARGAARVARYTIPVVDTVFTISDFLPEGSQDTVTTPEGLLGIRFPAESIAVDIGPNLQFNGVALTPFNASISGLILSQLPGTRIGFSSSASSALA